ncbi:nuclear cap-binding protein subunit 3 isoform X2 [Scleropages formosus]|uniref:nuclear cap-binding protein subunit 3 isoform X2 n=1 Tax=Scleropages formosus TaxID=113540 RepID=UPI0008789C4F|nr:nuclear cap-binding protein subunit 3 isoform X2 [Scleropages formosus]
MAAVRSLRVSVKPETGSDRSESASDSESDRDPREPEPMEVEEGELELEAIPVRRSLKELLPDTSRRYENKAGTFITGIDVTSKEAVEKKEQRAKRFHFRAEVNLAQRNVVLDRELLRKAIPKLRPEALHVCGVDEMSTQDVFGYFKEYPPAHIEWIDDTSCNVVWLDDNTSTRALINISRMPDVEASPAEPSSATDTRTAAQEHRTRRERGSDSDDEEEEEGEVGDDDDDEGVKQKSGVGSEGGADELENKADKVPAPESTQVDPLSQAEKESLLRNDLRPAIRPFKGNKLFLRFATQDDKKELGAARRSRYYMKYGNPNYGGMKGILTNSWKRRFHTRKIQRDVLRTKKPLIGDGMGHTPPYTHRHSDLVNLPEEPIEEEEEDGEEDMDEDDRLVEYWEERQRDHCRDRGLRAGAVGTRKAGPTSGSSDSDEMDYDLELKMISTPLPKKSMKMTMYADEVENNLKNLRNSTRTDVRNRIGSGAKSGGEKVMDVRQLLDEKRQGLSQQQHPVSSRTDVRQRLGKRPYSPESRRSPSPPAQRDHHPRREPLTDVRSRLGVPKHDSRRQYHETTKESKPGSLWSRLGSLPKDTSPDKKVAGEAAVPRRARGGEEEDSELQRVWGALIKEKEQQSHRKKKKSRLDSLPSLQIEISRDSSNTSDSES